VYRTVLKNIESAAEEDTIEIEIWAVSKDIPGAAPNPRHRIPEIVLCISPISALSPTRATPFNISFSQPPAPVLCSRIFLAIVVQQISVYVSLVLKRPLKCEVCRCVCRQVCTGAGLGKKKVPEHEHEHRYSSLPPSSISTVQSPISTAHDLQLNDPQSLLTS
jgi:hypothetical protein